MELPVEFARPGALDGEHATPPKDPWTSAATKVLGLQDVRPPGRVPHRPPSRRADSDAALRVGVCGVVRTKRDELNELSLIIHGVDEPVGGPTLAKGNGVHASKVPVLRIARPARIREHGGNDLGGQQNQHPRVAPEGVQVLRG